MSRTTRHRAGARRGPSRPGRTRTRGRGWKALAGATVAAAVAALVVAGCSDEDARRTDGRQQGPVDPVPVTLGTGPSSPAAALSAAPRPPSSAPASRAAGATAAPSPSATTGAPRSEPRPATAARSPRPPTAMTTPPAPRPSPSPSPAPSPSPRAAARALTIQDFAFSPRTMTVDVGTSVTATNLDSAVHTWTADAGAWDSGPLAQGQKFTFTFRAAGTYTFHCEPHPTMTGSIVVS